jgi:hypothetical protein
MSFKAEVLADSLSPAGDRLTTMRITFPRFILAEFNTHRMFSRNSASSRAIPFEKIVKAVEENPFIPIAWQKDHKGMQGTEYITDPVDIELNTNAWLKARDSAVTMAKYLNHGVKDGRDNGVTKQICNRLLEPFMWHTVICTFTEVENFFALRCPQYVIEGINGNKPFRSKKDVYNRIGVDKLTMHLKLNELDWFKINKGQAEIHMMALAEAMWDAYNESTPKQLKGGEWHIPFGEDINIGKLREYFWKVHKNPDPSYTAETNIMINIATAMCARVSYTAVGEEGKEPNYENDVKLHDRLLKSGHWSPFEHCAMAMTDTEDTMYYIADPHTKRQQGWCRNFRGFIQYRYFVDGV